MGIRDGVATAAGVSDAIWAIGARAPQPPGDATDFLQGQIDDVRIWSRALTRPRERETRPEVQS